MNHGTGKDSIMKRPVNITNASLLEKSGLIPGDPVHCACVGPPSGTNDAIFEGRLIDCNDRVGGVKLSIRGVPDEYPWADLMELWPIPPAVAHIRPVQETRITAFVEKISGT